MGLAICAIGIAVLTQGGPREGNLRVGDKAPDFSLRFLDSEKEFKLSSNYNKVTTVLIFGSST